MLPLTSDGQNGAVAVRGSEYMMRASSSHQEERMLSMHACPFEQPLPERELPEAVRDWSAPRKCFGKDVVIRVQRAFA